MFTDFIDLLDGTVADACAPGPEPSGCTGGLSTQLEIVFHGAGPRELTIDSCGLDEDNTFEAEANEFFSEWREELSRG